MGIEIFTQQIYWNQKNNNMLVLGCFWNLNQP